MRRTGALAGCISGSVSGSAALKFQPVKDHLPSSTGCLPPLRICHPRHGHAPLRAAALLRALRACAAGLSIGAGLAHATAPVQPAAAPDASASAPTWFNQVQPMATQATRAAFAGRPDLRVEVIPGSLDPRLNLAPCNKVQPYLPPGQRAWGRTRIGLRCVEGPVAWNVTMPLTVRVFATALVARQPLAAGTTLSAEHLQEAEAEWSASDSPVFTDIEALLGRALTRPLAPGQAVRESDVRKRQWFAAGDPVRLVVTGSGFSITGEGTALSPGLEGQLVRVRTEAGRIVSGRAKGERLVELDL